MTKLPLAHLSNDKTLIYFLLDNGVILPIYIRLGLREIHLVRKLAHSCCLMFVFSWQMADDMAQETNFLLYRNKRNTINQGIG